MPGWVAVTMCINHVMKLRHVSFVYLLACLLVCFFKSLLAPVSASNALKKSMKGPAVTINSWIEVFE